MCIQKFSPLQSPVAHPTHERCGAGVLAGVINVILPFTRYDLFQSAGPGGDHCSAAELAPLLAPLQIKVIAITRKGLELSVAPAANAIASEWVSLVCGAVWAATLGVDLPGVAPDPVGAGTLAGGQDGVEVGLLTRDAGLDPKLREPFFPRHNPSLGHACTGALAATTGLELPDDRLRFVIQIGEGEDEAAVCWKLVIRSWPRDRLSVYNAQTALGGPGIFFVVSSGGWGREEGRRDRGDGDRLPQRHRGRYVASSARGLVDSCKLFLMTPRSVAAGHRQGSFHLAQGQITEKVKKQKKRKYSFANGFFRAFSRARRWCVTKLYHSL